MAVPTRYVLEQGPVLATLANTALTALRQQFGGGGQQTPTTPSPEVVTRLPPRPAPLVRAYIRHVGGDPSGYRGEIPAHMFPQWGLPVAAKTLNDIPYPIHKVLNGGCRLEIHAPLSANVPLQVRARLEEIDDNGRRAVLHQRVATGYEGQPEAVVAHLYAIVPLAHKPNGVNNRSQNAAAAEQPRTKKERPRVPLDADELARWNLRSDAGLDFAKLTGDFNPLHWVKPYAKAFGYRSTILHGFATMARAIEGLQRGLLSGSTHSLTMFDCKFTRPLLLPARVGLYVRGPEAWVGDAPGGPAYLTATFTTNTDPRA